MTKNRWPTDDEFERIERIEKTRQRLDDERREAREQPGKSTDADENRATRFRQQHIAVEGDSGPAIVRHGEQVMDAKEEIGDPYVVRDVIMIMESRGTIKDQQVDAARKFEHDFARASLTGYQCPDMDRVMGEGTNSGGEPQRVLLARDRVYSALKALGGVGSRTSRAVWNVFGMGETMTGYSVKDGANRSNIAGMLLAACDTLVAHYGL